MKLTDRELLGRLGGGEPIAKLCAAAGISRAEFDAWWKKAAASRVPSADGTRSAKVAASVGIERDERGIPHISARTDRDLFFGFGYAMAQDRLFQLDYLRRKSSGRLAEILGPDGLPLDIIARTVGLRRIAEAEWDRIPDETRAILSAFSDGINAQIEHSRDKWPIEFDLLGYEPEEWSPVDCLAIEGEFRWYITGRFPVIVMPELAKRALGEGPLYREFLLGEADEESILPQGAYPPADRASEAVGQSTGDPDAGTGSNNWVVGGRKTATGKPLLASDPHIAFEAVSCWYQAHLDGGSFHVAGMTYVGMPAIMFGRNQHVAWGITNNICSQRELYQERVDPRHPGCFLFDGRWEPARELTETIHVKGGKPVSQTVRFSRNGPIVDEILPPPGNKTGPVALKWLGAYQGGFLTAVLAIDRARNADEFREALRPWHVPTFNLVFADVDGNIGMQTSGRIPIRRKPERGYRPGWDPAHQWDGLIPFEAMPGVINPERGWIATANNRLAGNDYPYPLSGTWSSGYRARRIRDMIDERETFDRDHFRDMQQDSLSLRAVRALPPLLKVLAKSNSRRIQAAAEHLRKWDGYVEPDQVGPTLFNVFFTNWARMVAAERFSEADAALLVAGVEAAAARLLEGDVCGWFAKGDREEKILAAFESALSFLSDRFGEEIAEWTWGRLHCMSLRHVLSSRGDLAELLDHGGEPVRGDMVTVCNTGSGPGWSAATGAGFRMIADLASSPPSLWTVDGQSQSGHPGSPHYGDQFRSWIGGEYYSLPLDRVEREAGFRHRLRLEPAR